MTATTKPQVADYVFTPGNDGFAENEAGQQLRTLHTEVEAKFQRFQSAWAGAFVASLFVHFPWLESMKIHISASQETGDEGETYRSEHLSISDVVSVPDSLLPEDVWDGEGFVEDSAGELLKSHIEEASSVFDLYSSFVDDGDFEDINVLVQRASIADLLANPEIRGTEAFVRLFPAYASRVLESPLPVSPGEPVVPQRIFKPVQISADWFPEDKSYPAFSDGQTWNGWAIPYFTHATGMELVADLPCLSYNVEKDAFITLDENEPDNEQEILFTAEVITVEGVDVKVYSIGGQSWCWDQA